MLPLIRGLVSGLGFCTALTASLFCGMAEVSACTPPPSGWFPSGVAPVPANGVVLLSYSCYAGCDTPPPVENLLLKDQASEPVPGSVVFSQLHASELQIAFRPEPGAVTEGSLYTAELDGVPTVAGILVGPALAWNDALTVTEEIFEVDYPAGQTRCCDGPIDSCGNTPCFHEEVDRRTAVAVGWYDVFSIEHYQYVFRMGRDGIDAASPWSWDGGDARFELDTTEDSACYTLELKRLADDSVQTFPSRCVEQPASFTPGRHATPVAAIAAVLEACDTPPDGYEAAWCEARRDLCETSPDEPWCTDFAARCAMTGEAGAAGAPNVAGNGGTAGNGGSSGNGGRSSHGGSAGNGGRTSRGGTAGSAGGNGGRAGSSGAQGGTAGTDVPGGTSSVPSGAGGTAAAGAATGEAGETDEAGEGKRVLTKACGCSVPGSPSREPGFFALSLALIALKLRRRARQTRVARAR